MTIRTFCLAAFAAFAFLCPNAWAQSIGGTQSVNHTPAVNTQASASVAALTGRSHVATSCSGSVTTVVAQTNLTLSLRDGATGAGTVKWSMAIACAIGTPCTLSSGPVTLPGTAATALTCEWSGIPAVGNFEIATLTFQDAS